MNSTFLYELHFLIKWNDRLCEIDFHEIITFLQNPS